MLQLPCGRSRKMIRTIAWRYGDSKTLILTSFGSEMRCIRSDSWGRMYLAVAMMFLASTICAGVIER